MRWLFILLLFTYLFALVTALFEAHSFQQLVSRLIATENDLNGVADQYRRRAVLLAVSDAGKKNPEGESIEVSFPNLVAGRLDGMQASIQALSTIRARSDVAIVNSPEAGLQAAESFDDLVNRLQKSSSELADAWIVARQRAATRDGSIGDDEATETTDTPPSPTPVQEPRLIELPGVVLMELDRAHSQLRRFEIEDIGGPGASPGGLDKALSVETSERKAELDGIKAELDSAFETIRKPIVLDSELKAALLNYREFLAKLHAVTASLDTARFRLVATGTIEEAPESSVLEVDPKLRQPPNPPTPRDFLVRPPASTGDAPEKNLVVPWLRFWLNQAGTYRGGDLDSEEYTADLAQAVAKFVVDQRSARGANPDRQPSIVGRIVREEIGLYIDEELKAGRIQFKEGTKDTPAPGNGKSPVGDLLADLSAQLYLIGNSLQDDDPQQRTIRGLYAPLAKIEAIALALQSLEVQPQDGVVALGQDPQREFQDQVRRLRSTFGRLQDLLKEANAPVQIIAEAIDVDVPGRERHAAAIWRAYTEIGRFQLILTPFSGDPSGFGFNAQALATAGLQLVDLMVVFVMGAIGSLIYITQYQLRMVIHGQSLLTGAGRSFAWYVFRPIFGVVIAFALYLLYKSGQIALGSGNANSLTADVNLPLLGLVSLLAGLMSWHVLDMVEARGRKMFSNARTSDMWATGLEYALVVKKITREELAGHLGVSTEQIARWTDFTDRVTPEMQDRIAAWLEISTVELFSNINPTGSRGRRMAYGLTRVMQKKQISAEELARRLGVEVSVVKDWASGKSDVAAPSQLALIKALNTTEQELFGFVPSETQDVPDEPVPPSDDARDAADLPLGAGSDLFSDDMAAPGRELWAVGLRDALREIEDPSSENLADIIGVEPAEVRAWMELEAPVPADVQPALQTELEPDRTLFSEVKPDDFVVLIRGEELSRALVDHPALSDVAEAERLGLFANIIDVNVEMVRDWIERRKPIAPATAERLRTELAEVMEDEFLELAE